LIDHVVEHGPQVLAELGLGLAAEFSGRLFGGSLR
jgi:hypothetical protein